jgi:hypothetical protein
VSIPSHRGEQVDLLLLNTSNLPWRPIYPYAFVQVSAVARRHGLRVERLDMLQVPDWRAELRTRIERGRPRAIGIHVRQCDTVDVSDYHAQPGAPRPAHFASYFPVEDTRRLIALARSLTRAPIVLGGFGFTTHAEKLACYLELDLGVRGCADGFLAHFDACLEGRELARVPGLVHHDGASYVYNELASFAPNDELEYDDAVIGELTAFYGARLREPHPPTIAVELSRGCPYQCYFCTEPDVKGRKVRHRSLEVVEQEVERLLVRGFRDFWFVCSELNHRGAERALVLAERMIRLSERHPSERPLRWSAYALPTLGRDELATLKRAGYVGAINDVLSLDDANLRRARVPYRAKQAVTFLKAMVATREVAAEAHDEQAKFTASTPARFERLLSMFLGNALLGPDTIADTLRRLDREGLRDFYDEGYAIAATRVFPSGRTRDFVDAAGTYSFDRQGRRETDSLWPTYHFPALLHDRLGSAEHVREFLDRIASTFLSTAHRRELDWRAFSAEHLGAGCGELVAQRVRELPTGELEEWLWSMFEAQTARLAIITERFGPGLFRGLRWAVSPYRAWEALYRRFGESRVVLDAVCDGTAQGGIERAFASFALAQVGYVYRAKWSTLLFGDPS